MRRLYITLCILGLASCGGPAKSDWAVSAKTLEKKGHNYSLKLEYPNIEGAPAALNKALANSALAHLEQVEDYPIAFDEYAINFAEDAAGKPWTNESVLTVVHRGKAVLTTVCRTASDTGSGHPNTFAHYETWDLRDGRSLDYTDLLEAGKADALRVLAGVPEGAFPNEPAVGLLPDTLVYLPDPDISATKEIRIPYDKLKGILKPQYLP